MPTARGPKKKKSPLARRRLDRIPPPLAIVRLAIIPVTALFTVLVSVEGVGAAGSFNPENSSQYCAAGTGAIDAQQLSTSCAPDITPGTHPDIVSSFNLPAGDYNFGGVVALSPSVPDDSAVPVGAILGKLGSQPTLGLLNNPCNTSQLRVPFTFMKGTTDIDNTVEPQPFGTTNDLAIMAGDNPPYDGQPDVKPPPAATKYPSFLNAIFDPNWVDFGPDKIAGNADDTYNGPKSPINPVSRAVGFTSFPSASNFWVILRVVVFDKGTKLPNLPAFDPAYGYPSVVVLQTSSAAGSATPPAPSAVTDFCTPLKTVNVMYGVTQDNPDTPANEGGIPIRTMPAAGTQIISIGYNASQRDPDGDGCDTPGLDAGTDSAGRPIPPRTVAGKGPDVPDGEEIVCIKVRSITSGGDPNVVFGPCQTTLPPLVGGVPETPTIGAAPGAAAAAAGGTAGTRAGGSAAGGAGAPVTGVGSLSPVGSSVPAWAAIAAGFGAAGVIGSLGTMASRLIKRRRDT